MQLANLALVESDEQVCSSALRTGQIKNTPSILGRMAARQTSTRFMESLGDPEELP